MQKARIRSRESFITGLQSLVTTPEVLRLINDITSCSMEWLSQSEVQAWSNPAAWSFSPA